MFTQAGACSYFSLEYILKYLSLTTSVLIWVPLWRSLYSDFLDWAILSDDCLEAH